MKSGLKVQIFVANLIVASVSTYTAMKSGLKAQSTNFARYLIDKVSTYTAMKSGLKASQPIISGLAFLL